MLADGRQQEDGLQKNGRQAFSTLPYRFYVNCPEHLDKGSY